jgi:spermidine synthase
MVGAVSQTSDVRSVRTEPAAGHDTWLILLIFLLSGAAGLIYEVVWSRQLVLVFGNTTQAVSTILTGFFGGMAIGSYLGGRLADRVRSPLRLYGTIELVLVVIVLATPLTFHLLHEVYRGAYPSLESTPELVALLRFGLAVVALSPATILMGATLPALTRHLTAGAHLSRAFGRLYAANTVGAIVGTLAAGVLLIELLGLTGTLVIGAVCSGAAGMAALLLSRRRRRAFPPDRQDLARHFAEATEEVGVVARPRLALVLAFVSGLTSLGYQVLWTRLLSSGTGNSTYVFTLILATFLLGIALGALLFSIVRSAIRRSILPIAVAQVLAGILALVGLVLVISNPSAFGITSGLVSLRAIAWPIVLVVLPTTLVMGFTFPASSALLGSDPGRTASSAGRLLAANTLGAIVATFAIPFLVIPVIGSPHAILVLAIVNAGMGLVLALAPAVSRAARVVAAGGALAAGVVTFAVLVSSTDAALDPSDARLVAAHATIFQSAEDEIASVQAARAGSSLRLLVGGTGMTSLTVDAKLMPILPFIARPMSTRALVVAFGMGSGFRASVIAGMQTDAVELVPSVPEMFGYFYPDATKVLNEPNGRVLVADGRNFIDLTQGRYDIIVTDPPPPIYSSGASVISSLEYYQAGHARLTPGGVMMQWFPFGGSVEETKAHIRTFRAVYPHVTVAFGPGGHGMLMLGSDAPITFTDAAIRKVLALPGVLADISSAADSPAHTVDDWARRIPTLVWITDAKVDRFVGDGPLVTDDRPFSEYFFLRNTFGAKSPLATRSLLVRLSRS